MRRSCYGVLEQKGSEIARCLETRGYYWTPSLLGGDAWREMRSDAERMRSQHRFGPSVSVGIDGKPFAKPGVFSCELEATDIDAAPHLLEYTRDLVTTLPRVLNESWKSKRVSESVYGTKLASTGPGAEYPAHVDNACVCDSTGLPHDTRWITCIYYMNQSPDGGELRLWIPGGDDESSRMKGDPLDIQPAADTFVVFFADCLVHEVLPTAIDSREDRYALTLWLVAEQQRQQQQTQDENVATTKTRSSSMSISRHSTLPRSLCSAERPGEASRNAHFF